MKCYECEVDMRKIGEREYACSNMSCPLVCKELDVRSLRDNYIVQVWSCEERPINNKLQSGNNGDAFSKNSKSNSIRTITIAKLSYNFLYVLLLIIVIMIILSIIYQK